MHAEDVRGAVDSRGRVCGDGTYARTYAWGVGHAADQGQNIRSAGTHTWGVGHAADQGQNICSAGTHAWGARHAADRRQNIRRADNVCACTYSGVNGCCAAWTGGSHMGARLGRVRCVVTRVRPPGRFRRASWASVSCVKCSEQVCGSRSGEGGSGAT